jgi:multidrug transporter EmrE-like cation transporter
MNIFNNGIVLGLILALIDIISMTSVKEISIKNLEEKWIIFAFMLYGSHMILFRYGLSNTSISMSTLNLTWNLFSSIVITIIGIYYYKENITNLQMYGVLFGLVSLLLFGLNEFNR